ncbi:MAG: permease-like cell division protein FtsX [Oscillospiraceae bacterium]|nr:permease-like cell division protein FtsX [Oscillospiraceae bacterium]
MAKHGRGYLTRMGFRNISSNRTMSMASVLVLVSCLMLIGLVFLTASDFNRAFQDFGARNVIRVFLVPGLDDAQRDNLQQRIAALDNVRDVRYVSQAEALEHMRTTYADDFRLLDGAREDFLPPSFEVSPTSQQLEVFDAAVRQLEGFDPAITSVGHMQGVAQQLATIERAFLIVGGALIIVLLLVSIFIISSTVQTTMFTRQQEIKVMKSVGAAPAFIRWPFLVEGLIIGFVGSAISLVIVCLVYFFGVARLLGSLLGVLLPSFTPLSLAQQLPLLLIVFFGLGLLTGGGGSMLSITRYLKENVYETETQA